MMRDNILALPCHEQPTRCRLRHNRRAPRRWLAAAPQGNVFLSRHPRDWEEWQLLPLAPGHPGGAAAIGAAGAVRLRSARHGWSLAACGADGAVGLLRQQDGAEASDGGGAAAAAAGDDGAATQWILEPRAITATGCSNDDTAPVLRLVSQLHRPRHLAARADGSLHLSDAPTDGGEDADWVLELLSGELCFLAHAASGRYLSSNPTGHLGMNANRRYAAAVWRFVEAGAGGAAGGAGGGALYINHWTRPWFFLCSDAKGRVFTSTNRQWEGSRWVVAKSVNGRGAVIQSVQYGHYLALDGSKLHTTDDPTGQGWALDAAHSNVFYLQLLNQPKSLVHRDRDVRLTDSSRQEQDGKFLVEPSHTNGRHTIRAHDSGQYLGVSTRGEIVLSPEAGEGEEWDISESLLGGVHITSSRYQRQLCLDAAQDRLALEYATSEPRASWTLLPAGLPEAVSDGKLLALAGAGVGAVALSLAAPLAVVGIGGLLVETVAAEAVVMGVAGGLLAGGALVTSTAAVVPNRDWRRQQTQERSLDVADPSLDVPPECRIHRPLCAWRTW